MGDFEMGEIPLTEEEEAELKAEKRAEMAAQEPVLPAQSQSGGLVPGLKKQEEKAGEKSATDNENTELKSKIGGGQVGLNLKGTSSRTPVPSSTPIDFASVGILRVHCCAAAEQASDCVPEQV